MPLSDNNDEQLVNLCLSGSESAFNVLVERHTASVYRLALSITKKHADAEDIVQETFMRAYRHIGDFDPQRAVFRNWILTIARNRSIDLLGYIKRKAARLFSDLDAENSNSSEFSSDNPDSQKLLEVKQRFKEIQERINLLPERQRTALTLKVYEGLSYEEIAQVMDTSASGVESLIFRARRKLIQQSESE